MQKLDRIDYAKLLGFASVSDRISGSVDFQDETIGAKLGAKVGDPEAGQPLRVVDETD
jgi:hypothetical protein